MSGEHGKNSPSQLKKRMLCPGSYQLESAVEAKAPLPDVVTEYSYRGEILHSLIRPIVEDKVSYKEGDPISLPGVKAEYVLTKKDIEHVEFVSNEIRADKTLLEKDDTVLWEQQVDLNKYGVEPSRDGNRIDCIFLKQRSIDIYEFKFGSSYVDEPRFNLQVIAYAIGARDMYGIPIEGVNVTILQPDAFKDEWRKRTYSFTNDELNAWAEKIVTVIETEKKEGASLCRGDHCEFCKVKKVCPLHRDAFLNIPQHIAPDSYFQNCDPERRKEFYEALLVTKAWIEKAITECEELALGGVPINGYHIGTGRVKREWTKPEAELIAEFPSLLIEKIMSPADAEKQHGKKFFRENLEQHVGTIPGNPKIVKD